MTRGYAKGKSAGSGRIPDGGRPKPAQASPVIFDVTVIPRAGRAGVEKTGDRAYRVRVTSPPEGGRANRDVLRLLAGVWGVPPTTLSIVRGETSRRKTVACRDPRASE